MWKCILWGSVRNCNLLYSSTIYASVSQTQWWRRILLLHWARRVIAWYGLDGRKLQKHQMEEAQRQGGHLWASPVSKDVHRCQQMPTKLSISDGDFSAISWNCLHWLSVMGGVPSVPYILPIKDGWLDWFAEHSFCQELWVSLKWLYASLIVR
jgi:hypothetical protein